VLAPLKPGGSWLVLKAAPLLLPLVGVWKRDVYTLQWTSMMILLYFTEGVVRGWSDRGQLSHGWAGARRHRRGLFRLRHHVRAPLQKAQRRRWPRNCWTRSRKTPFHERFPAAVPRPIGCSHVLETAGMAPYLTDWRGRIRRRTGRAAPGSVEQVAALVRACAQHGVPIVPQGGNTGLVLGSVPDARAGRGAVAGAPEPHPQIDAPTAP
jgi:hypothetical protein